MASTLGWGLDDVVATTRLDAVDFNAFLALECELLAGFASELGLVEEERRWAARHGRNE